MPESYVALAQVQFNADDVAGAVDTVLRGRRYGPSVPEFDDLLGRILFEVDRLADARTHFERALWIDGSLFPVRIDLVRLHALEARWDEVESLLRPVYSMTPALTSMVAIRLGLWRGRAIPMGSLDQVPDELRAMFQAQVFACEGRAPTPDEHAALEARLDRLAPVSRPARLGWQMVAETFGALSQPDEALHAIERAVRAGLTDLCWLRRCPVLAPVRVSTRFHTALREVEQRVQRVVDRLDTAG